MCTRNRFQDASTMMALASLLIVSAPDGMACGAWFQRQYLDQGGMSLLEPPQFFAEIELKLLARDFPTPFHAVHDDDPAQCTWDRDEKDFDDAVATGAIHPQDVQAAREAHLRMREAIGQLTRLTTEERNALSVDPMVKARKGVFPSEFADYHEGLLAFTRGDHANARTTWERLLARPAGERRYRSVEAAFMIGVLGVVENWEDTPHWFALARKLAQHGFRDEAGLAAASYQRESQWHEGRGKLHAAAECALRSIASGYPAKDCLRPKDDSAGELAKFTADPLLRSIYTCLLLAKHTKADVFEPPDREPIQLWLRALEDNGVLDFAGADRVAWLEYVSGDYPAARRWLAHAPKNSPRALWLTGKFAARDGHREESLQAYSAAARLVVHRPEPRLEVTGLCRAENTTSDRLAAEHAIVAIGAPDFRMALAAFLRGGHWMDAAYVADRLLNIEELREFVSRRPWQDAWSYEGSQTSWDEKLRVLPNQYTERLRWLLARRLVRAGRYREARPLFPPKWRIALDRYTRALAAGSDRRLPAESRAMAYWEASLEARYHGIELFGTEAAPDWFTRRGEFEEDDPAAYRRGLRPVELDRYRDSRKIVTLPAILRANALECVRVKATVPSPDKRFHYRYRAAGLAWNAARLLPDDDPRTAAILNLTGRWLAPRDPDAVDRFYEAIQSRCAETELGKRVIAKQWFVNVSDFSVWNRPSPLPGELSR